MKLKNIGGRKLLIVVICVFLFCILVQSAIAEVKISQALKLPKHPVKEASGLAASEQYPGIIWTHGDSSQPSQIIAIDMQGREIRRIDVTNAVNGDWESLDLDDDNNLWIFDWRGPKIYKFPEPDPYGTGPTEPAVMYGVDFSERWRNAEALFVYQGVVHIANKWTNNVTKFFSASTPLKENQDNDFIRYFAKNFGQDYMGADISKDGRRLALIADARNAVYVYERSQDSTNIVDFFNNPVNEWLITLEPSKKFEAVTFLHTGSGYDIVAASEEQTFWHSPQSLYESGITPTECTTGQTQNCGTSSVGACKLGKQTCTNGKWGACIGEVKPTTEICNQADDDCDGQVNEGIEGCGSGSSKIVQVIRLPNHNVKEASGLAASEQYPGIVWMQADSRSPAQVIAVDMKGQTIRRVDVTGANNRDWEALALDDENNLWILDQYQRTLYTFPEPDPYGTGPSEPATAHKLDFSSGWKNGEGLFMWQGRPHATNKQTKNIKHYASPKPPVAGQVTKMNEYYGGEGIRIYLGLDISKDGRRLAGMSSGRVYVFERSADSQDVKDFFVNPTRSWVIGQGGPRYEAVGFIPPGYDVVAASEKGDFWWAPQSLYESGFTPGACDNPDVDKDGYKSSACGGLDCNDHRSNIHPDAAEVCDGIDNNCDGVLDESTCTCTTGQTQNCGTSSVGACKLGKQTCTNGKWGACIGEVKPTTEICNQADDDCDGQINEGISCEWKKEEEPTPCTPKWKCAQWSECVNNKRHRLCSDTNNCGVIDGRPTVSRSCSIKKSIKISPTIIDFGTVELNKSEQKEIVLSYDIVVKNDGKVEISPSSSAQQKKSSANKRSGSGSFQRQFANVLSSYRKIFLQKRGDGHFSTTLQDSVEVGDDITFDVDLDEDSFSFVDEDSGKTYVVEKVSTDSGDDSVYRVVSVEENVLAAVVDPEESVEETVQTPLQQQVLDIVQLKEEDPTSFNNMVMVLYALIVVGLLSTLVLLKYSVYPSPVYKKYPRYVIKREVEKIRQYIKNNSSKPTPSLVRALKEQGWDPLIIKEAFRKIK